MKGLLLAGGRGTRLRPLTNTGNKHMLPIANQPMILYGLKHLVEAGITDIAVILGPLKEGIVELIGDGSKIGAKITYIEQGEPKGLAHAVLCAKDHLKDAPFVMYLGDNLLKQGARQFVESFKASNADCLIGVTEVKDPSRYGIVELAADGKIARLVEKPANPASNLALIGIYVFNSTIFEAIAKIKPSARNELEITDAIQALLNMGARIRMERVKGWWKDTGKPEDILEANQLVLFDSEDQNAGTVEEGAAITGRIKIGSGTVVRRHSILRGPIVIGSNCIIEENVYIGPYTSIGDNTRILAGEIENSLIMSNVTINTKRRIVDSIIGSNTTVTGMETSLPRGTRLIVGENTFVAI